MSVSSSPCAAGGAQCGVSYDAFVSWIWFQLGMAIGEEEDGAVREKEAEIAVALAAV